MLLTTHIASKKRRGPKSSIILVSDEMHLSPKGKKARKEGVRTFGMDSNEKKGSKLFYAANTFPHNCI